MNQKITAAEKLFANFSQKLIEYFPYEVYQVAQINGGFFGEKTVTQIEIDPKALVSVMQFLQSHSCAHYEVVTDITCIDYPEAEQRFQLLYNLLSIKHNHRLFVKTRLFVNEEIESITSIYPAADWYEREVWDLFGVFFYNHGDLRRILTDYGFVGHPFRKDFPISGYTEVRYNDILKQVVVEPLQLIQANRQTQTLSIPYNIIKDPSVL